jgi:ribonuclease HI
MPIYVVTAPDSIRGVYHDWPSCQAAVSGVANARYQRVKSREEADALLAGTGVVLAPGFYAFVDGNHLGGVGVVLVEVTSDEPRVVAEVAASVTNVFAGAGIASLDSARAIRQVLGRLRNVLAELGGLYAALAEAAAGSQLTVIHDFEGVGAWMEGRWRAQDAVVREVVAACQALAREKSLRLTFLHQPGHRSSWVGRHDLARFNARADALAVKGAAR